MIGVVGVGQDITDRKLIELERDGAAKERDRAAKDLERLIDVNGAVNEWVFSPWQQLSHVFPGRLVTESELDTGDLTGV